jgi:hypothetical protein
MRSWALRGCDGVSLPMYLNDLGPFMPAGHVAFGIRLIQTCDLGVGIIGACWLCCLRPNLKTVRDLLVVLPSVHVSPRLCPANSRLCFTTSTVDSGATVLNGAKRLFNTVLER